MIKSKVDFNKIEERTFTELGEERKMDYMMDDKGNAIIHISPLQFKIVEKLKQLEERIKVLEDAKKE